MHTTHYFGDKLGAIAISARKGSASKLTVGTVRRFTAAEQAIGAPMLKFTPVREITGKHAIKAMIAALDEIRLAYHRAGAPTAPPAYDAVLGG